MGVLLELSKAFDTVNYSILLQNSKLSTLVNKELYKNGLITIYQIENKL